jgi:hypothetical protein
MLKISDQLYCSLCNTLQVQTGVTSHAIATQRLRQTIPSFFFEVHFRMKRTSDSGISQAGVRRIIRETNRYVDVLNLSVCEDR